MQSGMVKEALGKSHQVQAGQPGKYSVSFEAEPHGFTCANTSN